MPDAVIQFREYIRLDRKQRSGGLTPVELERWMLLKRSLARKFSPGLRDDQTDRRASVRVPVQLRVDFPSIAALRGQLMTNLSRGGLFVSTTHLLEIGTQVVVHIRVAADGEILEAPAEVVSQNLGPRDGSRASGMGLRFLEMDEATQRKLDELYESALDRAAASGSSG